MTMYVPRSETILTLVALAFFCLPAGAAAQPLTIDGYEEVSETRVTRTVTEFTYRAKLTNAGPDIPGATASVTSLSPATTIVQGSLTFGPVAAGGSVWSAGTFTSRHDRTVPFDWSVLQWTVTPASTNAPPAADAGPDQTVPLGAAVQLDGSGSTDADGDPLTFHWSFEAVPPR